MPFTPLHMGPGMALKAVAQRHFSLVAFGFAQVAIDIEPLVRILRGDAVIHGLTHTYLGALFVAAAVFPVVWFSYPLLSRWWSYHAQAHRLSAFLMPGRPQVLPVAAGVLAGTLSHVAIDSVMHSDMEPLWPFSPSSPFYGVIGIDLLHLLCVASGVLGLLFFAVLRLALDRHRASR